MRKFLTVLLVLALILCTGAASAQKSATCVATDIDPENPAMQTVYVRFLSYNEADNTVTVELLTPEIFDKKEIEALEAGDTIFTGGKEVTITSVESDYGSVDFNMEGEAISLCETHDGNYIRLDDNYDYVWLTVAIVELEIPETLLFLDDEDPQASGLPSAHDVNAFLEALKGENGPTLDRNNAIAVFDADGKLAVVKRFYVPW